MARCAAAILATVLTACQGNGHRGIGSVVRAAPNVAHESVATEDADVPWYARFDLDGDGRVDRITASFSGGAHCCYRVAVELTSTGRTIQLPFELDGGYVGGIDLSQPGRFDVRRLEGRVLPELLVEIETYGGEPALLPAAWTRDFGISSHRVAVSFPNGTMQMRDLPWTRR